MDASIQKKSLISLQQNNKNYIMSDFNCEQYVQDNYGEEIIAMYVEEYGIGATLYLYSLTQDEVDEVLAKY